MPSEVRRGGAERLAGAGWDGSRPLVAMAPGAANGRAKQWPPDFFAAVAADLSSEGVSTVLTGTSADAGVARDVEAAVTRGRETVINLVGQTDLPALAGVLLQCRALITNDSGGMHFAAALGVNVTAMFGPSNEHETRPLGGGQTTILTNPVWCRPCMLRDCPIDHRCMRGITPPQVMAATRAALVSD